MRLRLGCELVFDLPATTPIVTMLNVHPQFLLNMEQLDTLETRPGLPIESFSDSFGNRRSRIVAPPGRLTLRTDGIVHAPDESDPRLPWLALDPVESLPAETHEFLLPSRYCESDLLSETAWQTFGWTAPDWSRVQAVIDHVHYHLAFDYQRADIFRTAEQAWRGGVGVCRDYAHLAIALCRALNIPARYCTGYISDVNLPPPYATMDFCAWMEVWIGGGWHVFDPRNRDPRWGRVLVGRGRDAADVPLTQSFGQATLSGFDVWVYEAEAEAVRA